MDYEIGLEVVKDIKVRGQRVGEYTYCKENDAIYYSINYPFPCKFAIQSSSYIRVTPGFLRLPTFMKWHNIDWLRQHLMQLKCIHDDKVLLHGAAYKLNGIGYLAVGFANSGKTTLILRALDQGAELCADENVIVGLDRKVIPVYRRSSISAWHAKEFKIPLTIRQKLSLKLASVRALCPLFEPNIWYDLPQPRKEIYLDRLEFLTPPQDKVKALALLTDSEFPWFTNPVIQAYAYATGLDLDALYTKYRKVLEVIAKWS